MTMPPDAPLTPAPAPGAAAPAASTTPIAPVAPVVVAKRGGGGRWVNVLLGAAAVIAVGGVAFAIGRSTAPATATGVVPGGLVIDGGPVGSFDPDVVPGGGPGGPAMLGGGPTIQGTVTAIDADSITIKLASGAEMTFALDRDTTYHESTATDPTTVQVGDEVAVQADGGRVSFNGNGNGNGNQGQGAQPGSGEDADLTANDVTVRR
jgi:hypothetical protein